MNLKEYIELGFLLLLILVLSMSTVIMSENLPMQIFAVISTLGTVLSMVVFLSSFDNYLQRKEFERISAKLDKLLEQAWENVHKDIEKTCLLEEVNRLNSHITEIKKKQLKNQSSFTISIFGLNQIESSLVCLIEIQSIIIKIKKYLDEVGNIIIENSNDNVKATLLCIRDLYERAHSSLPNLKYVHDIHKLNAYRTIFDRAEAEYNLIVSTTRSIKTNGEPK